MFKSRCSRSIRRLVAALCLLVWALGSPETAKAASRLTSFDPSKHGFNFTNDFNNDFIGNLDVRTGGLCGGMAYSALDYFTTGRRIPRQDYRPANRTTLQSYLYNRQVDSIVPNATKWAEIGMNPNGARNAEFFRWGLTSELENLKAAIDRGRPTPVGLKGVDGSLQHQVLAIGYQTGSRPEELAIYLYDPSFPNERITMRPSPSVYYFYYEGKFDSKRPDRYHWRTYFVDKSYRAKTPPTLVDSSYPNDGNVRELVVLFKTGNDDLRGGNDNVDLTLHRKSGGSTTVRNINLGARWLSNYGEWASVKLPAPVPRSDIREIEISTTFRGGIGGDNWDTLGIVAYAYEGSTRRLLAERNTPMRFTGDRRSVRIPAR